MLASTACTPKSHSAAIDPIAGEGMTKKGSGKRPERGGGRAWNKSGWNRSGGGTGVQAHNTEAETGGKEDWDRDESSEDKR